MSAATPQGLMLRQEWLRRVATRSNLTDSSPMDSNPTVSNLMLRNSHMLHSSLMHRSQLLKVHLRPLEAMPSPLPQHLEDMMVVTPPMTCHFNGKCVSVNSTG